ncbi:hypothetical protein [Nonomuraea sp. NPDC048826]|uniref:hypothetical protein n=1 Tax=Nonomuraea sp. NPDC048826 TaxID=3364347 RepID=UPI00371A49E0
MTDAPSAPWPLTMRAAYAALTLQMAFGLIALAVGVGGAVATMHLALGAYAAAWVALMALTALIMVRFPRRERRVRWGAVALQAAMITVHLAITAIDPGLEVRSFLAMEVFVPAFVIALLLTPAAGRWFDR